MQGLEGLMAWQESIRTQRDPDAIWIALCAGTGCLALGCQHVAQAPLYGFKKMWSMPAAGTYPGLTPILVQEYGKDIVIPSGGGMLGHPDGYTAGAQAWQQAIAAAMQDVPLTEAAKRPENKALRRAMEKWGYLERPKTPWLRVAPKFHPKPFKMEEMEE